MTFVRLRQAHDWVGAAEVPVGFRTRALAGGGHPPRQRLPLFDLARYLAAGRGGLRTHRHLGFDIEVEDNRDGQLRFARERWARVETSWTATGWDQAFVIDGTKGSLE